MKIMDYRKEVVENILSELNGRSGFDDWWYGIGDEIQEEITETLINLLPIHNSNQQRELLRSYNKFVNEKCLLAGGILSDFEIEKFEERNDGVSHSVMPRFDSPKNWTEDYKLENGNYVCRCSLCKERFYGYKRRVICKECAKEYNGRVYGKCPHRTELKTKKIEIMTETKQKGEKAFAIHNVSNSTLLEAFEDAVCDRNHNPMGDNYNKSGYTYAELKAEILDRIISERA